MAFTTAFWQRMTLVSPLRHMGSEKHIPHTFDAVKDVHLKGSPMLPRPPLSARRDVPQGQAKAFGGIYDGKSDESIRGAEPSAASGR